MNHKKRRAKNQRSGCLMCKPWKVNGTGKEKRPRFHKFSDQKRRILAAKEIKDYGPMV